MTSTPPATTLPSDTGPRPQPRKMQPMPSTRTHIHRPTLRTGSRTLMALAALSAAAILAGCASGTETPTGGTSTPQPAGAAAVLDAYAQVQAEVDAAVRAGGPAAVEAALAASTAQVVKETDLASALGRQIRLRITATEPGAPSAASGCAVLAVREAATYWHSIQCIQPGPNPEVELPEGQWPPDPSPPIPNGPLDVNADQFRTIMAALPPVITALEAHAQVEAAMHDLSGYGPLPRVEAQIRPAPDGSTDLAVAAFSYADRRWRVLF